MVLGSCGVVWGGVELSYGVGVVCSGKELSCGVVSGGVMWRFDKFERWC